MMTTIIIIIVLMTGITWMASKLGRFGSECDEQMERMIQELLREKNAKG